MSFVPAMWITWAAVVMITLILYVFKGRVEQDEEDQLFLDDSASFQKAEQAQIIAKVNRFQPILLGAKSATGIATLVVIVYYVRDIYVQLFAR